MDSDEWGESRAQGPKPWQLSEQPWEAALRALGEIAAAAAGAPGLHELAGLAVRYISEMVSGSSVALYWWEPGAQRLAAVAESDPLILGRESPPGSASWEAFELRQPIVVEDYQNWPNAIPLLTTVGVASVVSVPLMCGTEALGAISLRSRERLAVGPDLIRLLEVFAAQM